MKLLQRLKNWWHKNDKKDYVLYLQFTVDKKTNVIVSSEYDDDPTNKQTVELTGKLMAALINTLENGGLTPTILNHLAMRHDEPAKTALNYMEMMYDAKNEPVILPTEAFSVEGFNQNKSK